MKPLATIPDGDWPPAHVADYDSFIAAIRTRVVALELIYETVDELMCWPDGYAGKVLGEAHARIPTADKMFWLLGALGLRLVLEENPNRAKVMKRMWAESRKPKEQRKSSLARALGRRIVKRVAREMGRRGGGMRKRFRITPKQVSTQRRKAARARWMKPKPSQVLAANQPPNMNLTRSDQTPVR